MVRERPHPDGTRRVAESVLARTAERMVSQIQELVADIVALRRENDALRTEVHDAIQMLERASAALGAQTARARPGAPAPLRGRGNPKVKRGKGRATPAAVTPEVVRAVLAKLGPSTAAEIAAEISGVGVPVSGRAVRFIAERAGATSKSGEDGRRRYSFN